MRSMILLLLLLTTACAERWERPGATEAQSEATQAQCRAQAAATVPPFLVWQQTAPARIERNRDCRRDRDRERCFVTERAIPARFDQVDQNAGARDAFRQDCMTQKGFTFRGYRPLRLE